MIQTGSLVTDEKLNAALAETCPHTLTDYDIVRNEIVCICGMHKRAGQQPWRKEFAYPDKRALLGEARVDAV